MTAPYTGLLGQGPTERLNQHGVPCRTEGRTTRDAQRRGAGTQEAGATGTVGAVGDLEGRNAQPVDRVDAPHVAPRHQSDLLSSGQLAQEPLNPLS